VSTAGAPPAAALAACAAAPSPSKGGSAAVARATFLINDRRVEPGGAARAAVSFRKPRVALSTLSRGTGSPPSPSPPCGGCGLRLDEPAAVVVVAAAAAGTGGRAVLGQLGGWDDGFGVEWIRWGTSMSVYANVNVDVGGFVPSAAAEGTGLHASQLEGKRRGAHRRQQEEEEGGDEG
jgi:hypothetical protein